MYVVILPHCKKCGGELRAKDSGKDEEFYTPYWECSNKCVKYINKKELVADIAECLDHWIKEHE